MIIIIKNNAITDEIEGLMNRINSLGYSAYLSSEGSRRVIHFTGAGDYLNDIKDKYDSCIDRVIEKHNPFVLASREYKSEATVINIGNTNIGGEKVVIIAGPGTIESYEQCLETAKAARLYGADILNGGVFMPRVSSYLFQGIGVEELEILAGVKKEVELPVVVEICSTEDIELVSSYADIIQVGARNMQNFSLLNQVGKCHIPVLLKRGLMSTVKEFLMSAEYILSNGNNNVILCERGIRTFDTSTQSTPDLAAIPIIKELSHLPVIFDPIHSTGRKNLVSPMSAAALACGADGLIVEIQMSSAESLYGDEPGLTCELFAAMMQKMRQVVTAIDKSI